MATDSMNPEMATTEDQETATDSMNSEMATTEDQEMATDSMNSEMATTEDQEMATDSMKPEMATTEDQEMATDSMNSEMATTEDQETATDSMNSEMATTEDQETATDSMNSEMATTEDQEMATDSMNSEMATTEDQETATDNMNSEMATTEDQETATDSMNSEMATTEDQETATDSMNPEIISGEITGCPKLECQSGIKVSIVIDEKQGTTVSIAGKVIGRLPVLLCQMCTQSAPSHSWVDIMDSIVDFDLEIDLLAAETSNFADQFMEHVGIDLEQFSTQPDPFLEPDPEKVKTEAPSETNVSLQPRFAALISTEKRRFGTLSCGLMIALWCCGSAQEEPGMYREEHPVYREAWWWVHPEAQPQNYMYMMDDEPEDQSEARPPGARKTPGWAG
ncbi:hypothetical protein Bbelb_051570 [Branchiostoma belcheri]|nr:hypothetical protein Bbelb_051570 [Branchiostoma belcheri]